jgi:hypothetical protein
MARRARGTSAKGFARLPNIDARQAAARSWARHAALRGRPPHRPPVDASTLGLIAWWCGSRGRASCADARRRSAQVIKYGVVGADVLLRDLRGWDTLYIAGRLHKPVLHLARDAELAAAAEANLAAALAAGLLLLPARFSTEARRV